MPIFLSPDERPPAPECPECGEALTYVETEISSGAFRTQAAILTKAALRLRGLPGGSVRLPLVDATPEQVEVLKDDLAAAGVDVAG